MATNSAFAKLSDALQTRLQGSKPHDPMRVIVLLRPESTKKIEVAQRIKAPERKKLAKQKQRAYAAYMPEIDRILTATGGRRLANAPNVLGSLAVETNAAGIAALSTSDAVNAIFEDQSIKLFK